MKTQSRVEREGNAVKRRAGERMSMFKMPCMKFSKMNFFFFSELDEI